MMMMMMMMMMLCSYSLCLHHHHHIHYLACCCYFHTVKICCQNHDDDYDYDLVDVVAAFVSFALQHSKLLLISSYALEELEQERWEESSMLHVIWPVPTHYFYYYFFYHYSFAAAAADDDDDSRYCLLLECYLDLLLLDLHVDDNLPHTDFYPDCP